MKRTLTPAERSASVSSTDSYAYDDGDYGSGIGTEADDTSSADDEWHLNSEEQQFLRLAAAEECEELHNPDGFYDAPEEIHGYDATPDSGVHDLSSMDPEQRARLEEEWKMELAKVEEEILTLRQVVSAKMKEAQELKRKLGITAWKEFREDMEQGIKNIQESTAYQRTSVTLRSAGEKTTTALGTLGASVSKKLGDVKNSTAFKSFEEKMGSAYSSVKTKMSNSRSNSMNSFEESLNNLGGRPPSNVTSPVTSPTIPEEKPLA